jgi:hypothetical protein
VDSGQQTLAELKPVITVSLYKRPVYTEKILKALEKSYVYSKLKIPIIINIDPSPVLREVHRLAYHLMPYAAIRFYGRHQGCNRAIYNCLRDGFEIGNYVIHIEDDILLAKDAIKWFVEEGNLYKDNKEHFSVCGYQRENPDRWLSEETGFTKPIDILGDDIALPTFYPWGWATWKDRWEGIKDNWAFDGHEYGQSWDLYVKKKLRGDRLCVLPLISRVKNIGAENGEYTPSKEWHQKKHDIKIWSDDLIHGRQ